MYDSALPPEFQFPAHGGFTQMVQWVEDQAVSQALTAQHSGPLVCSKVATYPTGIVKATYTKQQGKTEAELAEYRCGATLSVAARQWLASTPMVGLVTSSMSNACEQSMGENNWHTVAVARDGRDLWVYDPAYDAAEHAGNLKRIDTVRGNSMVKKLADRWTGIQGAFYQGPPSRNHTDHLTCMGRSIQWIDATVRGVLPWPPNKDATGGSWTYHYRN